MNPIAPLYRFYTFPQLELENSHLRIRRVTAPKLHQNINHLKQQNFQLTEEKLAWHFLNMFLNGSENAEVEEHLKAFLASFSDVIVKRLQRNFERAGRNHSEIIYILQDAYQIAFYNASNPKKFFQNFDNTRRSIDKYSYPALIKYIQERMYGLVRDELIQERQVSQTINRTNLGLAANSSEKRVKDALKAQGLKEAQIVRKIGVWKVFKEVRKASQIDISSPRQEQFEEIARRYYQLNSTQVNSKTIREWLEEIGQAVRDYESPRINSLNTLYSSEDTTGNSLIEQISDTSWAEDLDRLAREEYIKNLRTFLNDEIQQLNTEFQSLLLLRHGLQMVQKHIAEEINKDTATVNRRYNSLLNSLGLKITNWANQQEYGNRIEQYQYLTSEKLKEIKTFLKDFLDNYYFNVIYKLFQTTFNYLPIDDRNILYGYYSCNEAVLANQMISTTRQLLAREIAQSLEKYYSLFLQPNGSAMSQLRDEKFINKFMDKFMKK